MLTIYIIDVEINSNCALNVIISLGPIPCFHLVTRILYMRKLMIQNTTLSDWG